jgi:hypothetical protein
MKAKGYPRPLDQECCSNGIPLLFRIAELGKLLMKE